MEEEPIVAEETEWEWVVECEVEEVTEEITEAIDDNNVNTEEESE